MLILAHAVVPHHHHNKVFVAIVNILNHDAQDIFNHEHDHEHHHEGNSEDRIKGFGSGFGALAIAFAVGEQLPNWQHIAIILLLGYVAYGLSIYFYTYAQRTIGAAKTSTYYALAPFIGALLSILLLGEPVTMIFIIASILMAAGCWIAAK